MSLHFVTLKCSFLLVPVQNCCEVVWCWGLHPVMATEDDSRAMKKSLREEQMLICSVLENLAGAQKCTNKKNKYININSISPVYKTTDNRAIICTPHFKANTPRGTQVGASYLHNTGAGR